MKKIMSIKDFPNEKSSLKEIMDFQPKTMFGSWYWFSRKRELLEKRLSLGERMKIKLDVLLNRI